MPTSKVGAAGPCLRVAVHRLLRLHGVPHRRWNRLPRLRTIGQGDFPGAFAEFGRVGAQEALRLADALDYARERGTQGVRAWPVTTRTRARSREGIRACTFVLVEGGIGWIPYLIERMDQTFEKHRFWTQSVLTERPSTYWHRQGHATFIRDLSGMALRHGAGVANIMWSTDYPHSDSTWPKSREAVRLRPSGRAGIASGRRREDNAPR